MILEKRNDRIGELVASLTASVRVSYRLYNVFPVVEMEYERREEGYASLGSYIDGRNSQGVCFAYSQPVVMCYYPDVRKAAELHVVMLLVEL